MTLLDCKFVMSIACCLFLSLYFSQTVLLALIVFETFEYPSARLMKMILGTKDVVLIPSNGVNYFNELPSELDNE